MIIKTKVPIYEISWLNYINGGTIGIFYEPENKEELIEICRLLYKEKKDFDIIGHTSNIYFLPDYSVDFMVSTRKVNNYHENDDYIIADCGVSVSKLSRRMVEEGIKGFEGLIDLPGTVAASVYGNASCYNCSINSLVETIEVLEPNGEIYNIKHDDLKLKKRSSSFKRGELKGIILSVKMRKEHGNSEKIRQIAELNHQKRKATQPPAKDNLGSIYANSNGWSQRSFLIRTLANCYSILCLLSGKKRNQIKKLKINFILRILGAKDLAPYVYGWNRFIWKDEKAHILFWKFHNLHMKLFKNSDFEIEIKGTK